LRTWPPPIETASPCPQRIDGVRDGANLYRLDLVHPLLLAIGMITLGSVHLIERVQPCRIRRAPPVQEVPQPEGSQIEVYLLVTPQPLTWRCSARVRRSLQWIIHPRIYP